MQRFESVRIVPLITSLNNSRADVKEARQAFIVFSLQQRREFRSLPALCEQPQMQPSLHDGKNTSAGYRAIYDRAEYLSRPTA